MDLHLSSAHAWPLPSPRAGCRRRAGSACRPRICAFRGAICPAHPVAPRYLHASSWSRPRWGDGLRRLPDASGGAVASMTWLQGLMISLCDIARLDRIRGRVGARRRIQTPRSEPLAGRGHGGTLTALVMPIYNEDPTRTTAALQAMARPWSTGAQQAFEIVVLSDSRMRMRGCGRPWRSTACGARSSR